jgi:hypothetical protein
MVATAIGRPLELESFVSRKWGAVALNRALRNLAAKTAVMVQGHSLDWTPGVEVHQVPGASREALLADFKRFLENRVRAKWRDGFVGETPARLGHREATRIEQSRLVRDR